jgi:hypothetical protein
VLRFASHQSAQDESLSGGHQPLWTVSTAPSGSSAISVDTDWRHSDAFKVVELSAKRIKQ